MRAVRNEQVYMWIYIFVGMFICICMCRTRGRGNFPTVTRALRSTVWNYTNLLQLRVLP